MKLAVSMWQIIKESFRNFFADRVLKLSAALAYYAVLALPPLLLLLIAITGYFYGEEALRGKVFSELDHLIGEKAALQIQEAIKNIHVSGDTAWATAVGIITLLLSATGIFGEIQDSINLIWGLKVKPKKGLIKMLITRLISFSLIISISFVMLVALIINAIIAVISDEMRSVLGFLNVDLLLVLDYMLQFVIVTFLFAIIFKVLPDAKIKWKDVGMGAAATSVLFFAGKFILGYYLTQSSIITAYGAAGSVILLLLWVYYSSAILYLGAEFTQSFSMHFGSAIEPNRYAEWAEEPNATQRLQKTKIKAD